jgi:hypothetical protein
MDAVDELVRERMAGDFYAAGWDDFVSGSGFSLGERKQSSECLIGMFQARQSHAQSAGRCLSGKGAMGLAR